MRPKGSSSLRCGLVAAFSLGVVGIVAAASGAACLPDPKSDFQDFKDRTANLQQEASDASFDSKPPEAAVEGLYVGICVTVQASRDPEQALRFYTETKYVPDGPGSATGKLAMTVTPMVGWDSAGNRYTQPATVSQSETRGTPIVVPEMPVGANGRFTANLGTMTLVKEANSVSGREAVIEETVLDGLFSAGDRFCSTLGGLLTSPYESVFNPKENTCLFQRVNDGDPLPKIASAEFACNF